MVRKGYKRPLEMRETYRGVVTSHLRTWIQCPGCIGPVEIDNRPKVIEQGDVDVETASDEATSVEQVMIILLPSLGLHFLR